MAQIERRGVRALGGVVGVGLAGAAGGQVVLDPSFPGVVRTGLAGATEAWEAVAVQADGRIVAVGRRTTPVPGAPFGSSTNFLVARYLPSGGLDPSFAGGRPVEIDVAPERSDVANSVVVLEGGEIIVAGTSVAPFATVTTPAGTTFGAYSDVALARLEENGSLDTTFGVNGVARFDYSGGLDDTAEKLLLLPDGSLRTCGITTTNAGNRLQSQWLVAGFTGDGLPDTRLGTTGRIVIDPSRPNGRRPEVWDAAMVGDRITVVGGAAFDFGVARLDAVSGAADTSFGDNGFVTVPFAGDPVNGVGQQFTTARSVVALPDGRVTVVGDGTFFNLNEDTFVSDDLFAVRLGTSGRLDPTFDGFPSGLVPGRLGAVGGVNGRIVLNDDAGGLLYNAAASGALVASPSPSGVTLRAFAATPDGRLAAVGAQGGDGAVTVLLVESPGECAADFNGDGSTGDIFDLFDFLSALEVGLDFNADGTPSDIFDLFEFLAALDAGCP